MDCESECGKEVKVEVKKEGGRKKEGGKEMVYLPRSLESSYLSKGPGGGREDKFLSPPPQRLRIDEYKRWYCKVKARVESSHGLNRGERGFFYLLFFFSELLPAYLCYSVAASTKLDILPTYLLYASYTYF